MTKSRVRRSSSRSADKNGAKGPAAGGETSAANAELEGWLARFQAAVRRRDFQAGRALFAPDAVAFGTRAEMVRGLDDVVAEQWRPVWPRIHDFRLGARVARVGSGSAWIATMWQTTRSPAAGPRPIRRGRGTFVLERRDGQWLAVHSHFSLTPEGPRL